MNRVIRKLLDTPEKWILDDDDGRGSGVGGGGGGEGSVCGVGGVVGGGEGGVMLMAMIMIMFIMMMMRITVIMLMPLIMMLVSPYLFQTLRCLCFVPWNPDFCQRNICVSYRAILGSHGYASLQLSWIKKAKLIRCQHGHR